MWQQSREPPASRALLSVLQLLVHPVVLEERQVLSDLQGRFLALGGARHALDRLVDDRRLQLPLRAALQFLCLQVGSGGVPEQRNT